MFIKNARLTHSERYLLEKLHFTKACLYRCRHFAEQGSSVCCFLKSNCVMWHHSTRTTRNEFLRCFFINWIADSTAYWVHSRCGPPCETSRTWTSVCALRVLGYRESENIRIGMHWHAVLLRNSIQHRNWQPIYNYLIRDTIYNGIIANEITSVLSFHCIAILRCLGSIKILTTKWTILLYIS